jgi:hypothetical protein
MPTPQHQAWIDRGRPWRLAQPLKALRDRLRGYGYVVYDIGDITHLNAQPPERHCPYSETNWPSYVDLPMPDVVTAIDVMPPPPALDLPSLQTLGAQMFKDKQTGVIPWLCGMNWGPTSNRSAVRDIWRPNHSRRASSDAGHIHAECRSDQTWSSAADAYDPVAAIRGAAGKQEDDMGQHVLVRGFADNPDQVWLCDGITRRRVSPAELGAVQNGVPTGPVSNNQTHQAGLLGQLGNGGRIFVSGEPADAWGVDVAKPVAVKVDAAELAAAMLADPAFATAMAEATFQGSQRSERE